MLLYDAVDYTLMCLRRNAISVCIIWINKMRIDHVFVAARIDGEAAGYGRRQPEPRRELADAPPDRARHP